MSSLPTTLPKPKGPITDGSAAELLHFATYTKKGASAESWTRFATANEKFELVQADGKKYLLEFTNNFSKKHLATLSKKDGAAEARAKQIAQQKKDGTYKKSQLRGKRSDTEAENLIDAKEDLLAEKILHVLEIRGAKPIGPCLTCGHPGENIPIGSGHNAKGLCRVTPTDTNIPCTCTHYVGTKQYEIDRKALGKPDLNPLAGASTKKSTVLVLSYIPLSTFSSVVAQSIVAADPTGAVNIGDKVHLKWAFKGCKNAIVYAEGGKIVQKPEKQWVEVGAQKVPPPTGIASAWQVYHWHADGV